MRDWIIIFLLEAPFKQSVVDSNYKVDHCIKVLWLPGSDYFVLDLILKASVILGFQRLLVPTYTGCTLLELGGIASG
jgi:hypothetical protein